MAKFGKFERVVQLELNEISLPIVKSLTDQGKLPYFKRICREWTVLESTSEDVYENIEPWIQWVTAHTGKSFSEHKVFRLGDSHELKHPQIWEILSDHGIESAVIGAMNASRGRTKGGVFFPDPWSKENSAYPDQLKSLWQVISSKVQAHAASQPSIKDLIRAFTAARSFEISAGLAAKIAAQVFAQKLEPKIKWKLVGLFDEVQSDIFTSVLKDSKYKFCSLFLNSIAHYQHHFWRQFDKSEFSKDIECPDCRPQDNPIIYGLDLMDRIIGKVIESVDLEKTLVMIATGLSQVADKRHENAGGMNYFRLKDHKHFAVQVGLDPKDVFPLMSRDWQIHFDSEELARKITGCLASIHVRDENVFAVNRSIDNFIFVETAITKRLSEDSLVQKGDKVLGKFSELFANIAVKSGHHSGKGTIWMNHTPSQLAVSKSVHLGKLFDLGIEALVWKGDFVPRCHNILLVNEFSDQSCPVTRMVYDFGRELRATETLNPIQINLGTRYRPGGTRPLRIVGLIALQIFLPFVLIFWKLRSLVRHQKLSQIVTTLPPLIHISGVFWGRVFCIKTIVWYQDAHPEVEARILENKGFPAFPSILRFIDSMWLKIADSIVVLDRCMMARSQKKEC